MVHLLIGEKDGMEFWRIAIFIVIGIVWTLNRECVLHGNFIFPSLCRNRVHREEDRKIKLEHGFIYIFRLFVKGFIASFRVWKIFGVSNGRGIISVSTGGYRAAIGIVNTPALTRRENRASIGRRVFHINYRLPYASDNKFSARCTRARNFSNRVYLAANDLMIYLCTLADVYLYAVPGEPRGGSQESSFTEARAVERKVITRLWISTRIYIFTCVLDILKTLDN